MSRVLQHHYNMKLATLILTSLLLTLGIPTITMANSWKYEQSNVNIQIDTQRTGQITSWKYGGKTVINPEKPQSPLTLQSASNKKISFTPKTTKNIKEGVQIHGQIGAQIPTIITYQILDGGRKIKTSVQFDEVNKFSVSDTLEWSLPLALQPRKRIWFRGDYGLEWDTLYFYQFTLGTTRKLLPYADRNEWRYFGLDQLGKSAFRLWKSESQTTSPLQIQEGKIAVPAMQIYDMQGGISIEYPQLNEGLRSLRVDAANGGTAKVLLQRPDPIGAQRTTAKLHEIILTAQNSEKSAIDARKPMAQKYATNSRPTSQEVMQEEPYLRETAVSNSAQYVTGGYPFAQGKLRDISKLRVAVSGESVPVQAKILGYWPDKSIKWALLTFPINPAKAVARAAAPRVSLRNGKFLPVSIMQDDKSTFTPKNALQARQNGDSVRIINGDWNAEFATGAQWLKTLQYKGKSLLRQDKNTRLTYADYQLNPTKVLSADHIMEGGERDAGTLKIDKLTLEEAGPLRAVVRLEGMTDNAEPTRIILRIEMLAGRPELRITHSAEFRFKDPRKTFLTGLGIELPLAVQQSGQNERETLLHLGYDHQQKYFYRGGNWQISDNIPPSQNWVQIGDNQLEITGIIRNARQTSPKAISTNSETGNLRLELWPEAAGAMDVRRYSDYPHHSQGESVPDDPNWVPDFYYKNDPFVGITRTHELLLRFENKDSAQDAASLSADFQSPPLLYAGWDEYQATKVLLPAPSEKDWPHAWQNWTNIANFWLWHQRMYRWYGFWDYGDIRHLYQNGYGSTASPQDTLELLAKKDFISQIKNKSANYRASNDWAFDNGRWGWGNTEGLPNLFLQQEYLRHGNRAVYFASEALGRHGRDVVTRHEGKWFGAGTRHGVQHWSDGNHEERQTTVTEYRINYFLSGDGRSLDTINKLYDKHYSKTRVRQHAQHSARLGGLLFHWEITGSDEGATQLQNYAHLFAAPDGIYISPDAKFPGGLQAGPPKELNSENMFFHYFGGMHALIEYATLTSDAQLTNSLIKFADTTLEQKKYQYGGRFAAVAFAAKHAANPQPYRQALLDALDVPDSSNWKHMYQGVTDNPAHWSGNTGYVVSSIPGTWFQLNWMPYVASASGNSERWNPKSEAEFQRIEKEGNPRAPYRQSWQDEFDGIPGLAEYLEAQQPWRNK